MFMYANTNTMKANSQTVWSNANQQLTCDMYRIFICGIEVGSGEEEAKA